MKSLFKIDAKKILKGAIIIGGLALTLMQNKDSANDRETMKADIKKELLDEMSKEN